MFSIINGQACAKAKVISLELIDLTTSQDVIKREDKAVPTGSFGDGGFIAKHKELLEKVAFGLSVAVGLVVLCLICFCFFCIWARKELHKKLEARGIYLKDLKGIKKKEDLLQFLESRGITLPPSLARKMIIKWLMKRIQNGSA